MSENDRFCTACGARLPEGSLFCPECGRSVDGGENPYAGAYAGYDDRSRVQRKSSVPIFIILYGIFGLIVGASMLSFCVGLNEASYNELLQTAGDMMGSDVTGMMPAWSESLKNMLVATCVFGTVSPICALVSYVFCWRNGPWKYALAFCALADVLILGMCLTDVITAVILFIIGLIVTYKLYTDRETFSS